MPPTTAPPSPSPPCRTLPPSLAAAAATRRCRRRHSPTPTPSHVARRRRPRRQSPTPPPPRVARRRRRHSPTPPPWSPADAAAVVTRLPDILVSRGVPARVSLEPSSRVIRSRLGCWRSRWRWRLECVTCSRHPLVWTGVVLLLGLASRRAVSCDVKGCTFSRLHLWKDVHFLVYSFWAGQGGRPLISVGGTAVSL